MSTESQYDVFLSYNQADKPRVRWVAERLRAAAFGALSVRTSDFGFRASAEGGRVGLERSTVLFRDPANAGRRFIPLLLADCKLPDTLGRTTPSAAQFTTATNSGGSAKNPALLHWPFDCQSENASVALYLRAVG